ncbi:hypothetical protein [Bacillus sp. JJ1562]|uniref:hypothetical protein n=1 Tax=Bacillus sp. JJ1562 TaxID=3122960 RepID=UPI0030013504
MNSFKIYNSKKLARKNNILYLATATLKEIKEWELQTSTFPTKEEVVNIYTKNIKIIKEKEGNYDLEVQNGFLLTALPNLEPEDELPVLINNSSQISIVINALLQIEAFKKFVELKSDKISNNSTKIMTVKTLETLVLYLFENFTIEEVMSFLNEFVTYVEKVIGYYEIFRFYSVKHVKNLKRTSIIHSTFSWYIIFRFFVENYQYQVYKTVNIPKLDLDVKVGSWKGNLFEKSNPIWNHVYSGRRKFYPTKENLETTYKVWIDYQKSL